MEQSTRLSQGPELPFPSRARAGEGAAVSNSCILSCREPGQAVTFCFGDPFLNLSDRGLLRKTLSQVDTEHLTSHKETLCCSGEPGSDLPLNEWAGVGVADRNSYNSNS